MSVDQKIKNHQKQYYKKRSRPIVHKTLQFQINILFILLMLVMAITIIVIVQTIGKSLIINENYRFIEQKGQTIIAQLGQRISFAEAMSKSLANIAEITPKDEVLYRKIVPQILYGKKSYLKVAGGGIWPEPYAFETKTERRSFFWGYDAENKPAYFDNYNNPDGPGYHSEEWYVPVRYLKTTDTYWSKSYIDPYSNEPMVTNAAPIYENSKFSGVSTIDLKLNDLKKFLDSEATEINGYIFAVDRNNKFLSFPDQSYVKIPARVKSSMTEKEFIDVEQLAKNESHFLMITEALEVLNTKILSQSSQNIESENELAQRIASESYQISLPEAKLIASIIARSSEKSVSTNFKPIPIENDFILNDSAVAFVFLMPKTYWKIVIVSSLAQVTKVANDISQQILIYISIGMLGCVLIAYLYLRYVLVMPLKDMTKQLIKALQGKGNQLITLQTTPKNELDELVFWFNCRTEELRNSNKKLNQEVTAHKDSQEALKRSEQQLSIHLQNTPIGSISWDLDFKVVNWNPAAERIFGYTKEETIGKHVTELILPENIKDLIHNIFQDLLNGQGGEQSTNENITKSGERILCDWYNTTLKDADGVVTGVASLVKDITDQKKTEEMMIQSEKMMSVGGLAAGMAHEINNPLAGMIQNSNVLSNRLTDKTMPANVKAAGAAGTSMEAIHRYMENRNLPRMIKAITESGARMATIVENMLSFARKSDSTFSSHNPVELLDKVLELASTDFDLKKHYDFKSIAIEKIYEKNLPLIACESGKIQQVLLNILKNGAYAMFKDSSFVKPKFIFRLQFESASHMLKIEIEDNGPGMDKQTCKRIFEPFFTTKSIGVGTGLGLSVSYFIITENHKGSMTVASEPGKGANFIIRLPIERKNQK